MSRANRGNSAKVALFSLGVDSGKELIYSRLKIEDSGAGYCHFPIGQGYDEEYFEQLTAEKAVTRVRNSVKSRVCARYGTTTLLRSSGGAGWFICIHLKASYDYIFGSFYFHFAQPLLPLLQHR